MARDATQRRVAAVGRTPRQRKGAARTHWPAAHARAAGQFRETIAITMGTRSVHMNEPTNTDPGTGRPISGEDPPGRVDPPPQSRGECRMVNVHSIDELAQRLAALVPPGMQQAREDLANNFRSLLQ